MLAAQFSEKNKGGGTREGKTYHEAPPQKRCWTPPLMIRPPPPFCSCPVISLRGNGHRPDESHFLRPPKLVLEGTLYGTFPPPPSKISRYVLPPPLRIPKKNVSRQISVRVRALKVTDPKVTGGKDPHPQDFSLPKKTARFTSRANFVLTKDRKRPYYGRFCGKIHREGSCSKAALTLWTSRICFIFFCLERRKGRGGGDWVFIEIPGGGGCLQDGRGREAGRVCGELGNLGGV